MNIISTIQEFRKWRKDISGSIGFVPTMGALHEGHLALVAESNKTCKNTVVSIYLNPAQFAQGEDLTTYPKTIEADLEKLTNFRVDCIFLPNDSEMYPDGFSTRIQENNLSCLLEGKSRPEFFSGVTTIVAKFFNIVEPTHAFFGEKDAQQLLIVKKMVKDMAYPIDIISCPIIRHNNGLAMSSRNSYLSESEQEAASIIYRSLQDGKNLIISGERNAQTIRDNITQTIMQENLLRIDYVSVTDAETLVEISGNISNNILVSTALFLGKTRLIDNFSYSVSSNK